MLPVDRARIAILILNYNGADLLPATLDAVRRHTDLESVSVTVIDNASTDTSKTVVEGQYAWVHWLANPSNVGFAAGVNRGFRDVKAQAYVVLNSDAVVTAGWLERLEATAASAPEIGVVAAVEVVAPGKARFVEDAAFIAARGRVPVVDLDNVSLACALVKRAVVDRIGGLDDGFFMYYEDLDFSHRAQAVGFRTVLDPWVEVLHVGRASFERQPGPWKVKIRTASRQRYQLLHWPAQRLWASVGREAVLFAYWTKEGHPLAYLQGCWTTLRSLPDIRRKRRAARGLAQRANE